MSDWTPPESPSPKRILSEARADAKAGRYEDALIKHLWYHRNALRYEPAQYGVRTSFALSDWKDLGDKFEPARVEFEAERARAKSAVDADHSNAEAISDWAAFNWALGQSKPSSDFFLQLHEERSPLAKALYRRFEEALLAEKEFEICGEYVDPDESFEFAIEIYRRCLTSAIGIDDPIYWQVEHRHFAIRASELVAILSINGRHNEAETFAARAIAELQESRYQRIIDEALTGQMPDRGSLADDDLDD